jgi:hypothetical protein
MVDFAVQLVDQSVVGFVARRCRIKLRGAGRVLIDPFPDLELTPAPPRSDVAISLQGVGVDVLVERAVQPMTRLCGTYGPFQPD